jgi:hypothetical protein
VVWPSQAICSELGLLVSIIARLCIYLYFIFAIVTDALLHFGGIVGHFVVGPTSRGAILGSADAAAGASDRKHSIPLCWLISSNQSAPGLCLNPRITLQKYIIYNFDAVQVVWFVSCIPLSLLFGVAHQGGVLPSLIHFSDLNLQQAATALKIELIYYRTYMPPRTILHLSAQQPSKCIFF